MAIETFPFDPASYLTSDRSQAELLDEAFASDDVAFIATALGIVARARGMTDVARDAGVTREALYRTLSESGDPKLSTLLGVMRALDVSLRVQPAHKR